MPRQVRNGVGEEKGKGQPMHDKLSIERKKRGKRTSTAQQIEERGVSSFPQVRGTTPVSPHERKERGSMTMRKVV